MKVVLFCGGQGLRLRDYADLPKPLVPIGERPILWHIMKYYAYYGHKDFILCLGYKANDIKRYFLDYELSRVNDFVLSESGVHLLENDIKDWRITFVDTGSHASVGQRLKKVREHLRGEKYFLANYSDGLTDEPLPGVLEGFKAANKVASMICVNPHLSLHQVALNGAGEVTNIGDMRANTLINGGYFMFREDIFEYIDRGEDLVGPPFERLIQKGQLQGRRYGGFWSTMDTFKDNQALEELYATQAAPWEVWKKRRSGDRELQQASA